MRTESSKIGSSKKNLGRLKYAGKVVIANKYSDMQTAIDKLSAESRTVGLNINRAKTKTIRVNASNETSLYVEGNILEAIDHFEYLGSNDEVDGGTGIDIELRANCWDQTQYACPQKPRCLRLVLRMRNLVNPKDKSQESKNLFQ